MDFDFLVFFSYAAWKAIWSQYINENNVLHKNTCPFNVLPQTLWSLYSNAIKSSWHRSNISQGTAGPSSGVSFHFLSDPENLRNAYYTNSRAILEKLRFSHVDLRVVMKITVLPVWVTLNGLRHLMIFSLFLQSTKQRKQELSLSRNDFHCFELLGPTNAYVFPLKS